MSLVSLLGVNVLNNPAKFTDAYEFEITFECLEPLKEDLEWKLTYVGSSKSLDHDQELDSILVGPVPVGVNKFLFTADPPSPELIPSSELVSVTVILLSCSYKEKEFVRVGYYVNNEYDSEDLRENPPAKVQVDHIVRNILAEKPRVTRFNIVWDNENENPDEFPPEQPDVDLEDDDEEDYAADELEEEVEGSVTKVTEDIADGEPGGVTNGDEEENGNDAEADLIPTEDEAADGDSPSKKRKVENPEEEEEEAEELEVEEEDIEEDLEAEEDDEDIEEEEDINGDTEEEGVEEGVEELVEDGVDEGLDGEGAEEEEEQVADDGEPQSTVQETKVDD
ncbi:BA75_03253T0 [Komagataella pastoris]|uniref:Histone chaperone ASF1 n=1 Tax=Komagataella pastoris TaxID=4922 RepID=A0A1B2JA50_PICPA|nr:BA75_03253T0 [Komagataella pastoris]